jgi:uncharacterized protein (TIGR03382 family)
MRFEIMTAIGVAAALASQASAAYTVTQQAAPAPTYSTLLDFDQPGQATGVLPANYWQPGYGVSDLNAGDSVPLVDNLNALFGFPWLPNNNSFYGNFGVFLTLDAPVDALSLQAWDPSGPASPFGGGMGIFVFNDGNEVGSGFFTPSWAGAGDSWFDIVATGGMEFDEVRILGFGFGPTTIVDNISWNTVPTPGAVALFGVAGAFVRRRRR